MAESSDKSSTIIIAAIITGIFGIIIAIVPKLMDRNTVPPVVQQPPPPIPVPKQESAPPNKRDITTSDFPETRTTEVKHPPPPVSSPSDTDQINAFRWRYEAAMNAALSTADWSQWLNLSVEKLNPTQAINAKLEQLRIVQTEAFEKRQVSLVYTIGKWTIESISGDSAMVQFTEVIAGQEAGRPQRETRSGHLRLAKVNGEWLMAPGGN